MTKRIVGERAFFAVWAGQLVSTLGSNALVFALSIVAFQRDGHALGLVAVLASRFLPQVVLSPVAGAVADRFPRRAVMIGADGCGAALTLVLLVLLAVADPGVAVYAGYAALIGICETFQQPAYLASVTTLVRKHNFGRAAGMISLVESVPRVLAPLAGGVLLATTGLHGVGVIDLATFVVAMTTLAVSRFQEPERQDIMAGPRLRRWLADATFGFTYIWRRASLLALQLVFTVVNLLVGMGTGLVLALVLARTGQDEAAVGLVQGVGALGAVAGGILVSVWGGPRRRVAGLLGGAAANLVSGRLCFALVNFVPAWAFFNALGQAFIPLVNSSNQAIWQAKVGPEIQGRVFAARRVLGQVGYPIGLLGVGALVDRVFEPGIVAGQGLLWAAGRAVFGTGPGSGSALLMALTGLVGVVVTALACMLPVVRDLEERLPDAPGIGAPGGEPPSRPDGVTGRQT